MDVTNDLAGKLPGIINPVIDKAIAAVQSGESGALDALKTDLATAIQGGLSLENNIDQILTKQREAFFVDMTKFRDDTLTKLKGWKLFSENTLQGPNIGSGNTS